MTAQTRVDCLVRCTASPVQNLRSPGQSNEGEGTRSVRCTLADEKSKQRFVTIFLENGGSLTRDKASVSALVYMDVITVIGD